MWKKSVLGAIALIGLLLIAMLAFGIGGPLPGWALAAYIPFVFIGAAILKWITLGFRRGRRPISN